MSTLTLLTLPIGNMGDITVRGRQVLEKEQLFLAEDTRVLRSLMRLLNIDSSSKKIISFHDHSSDKKICQFINNLEEGERFVLVSDAGSPIISDPAFPLVKKVIEKGFQIESVSGITSIIVALELSGLPPNPFHFHGFFPREKDGKRAKIESIGFNPGTHIFFESPNRVLNTLDAISKIVPESDIAVARELTKKFETVYRFKAREFANILDEIVVKGEFVIMINISKDQKSCGLMGKKLKNMAQEFVNDGGSKRLLAKILGEILQEDSKKIYSKLSSQK